MARFRLRNAHYLSVPGTEWEQKETSTVTGKQVRKVYSVPMYLDPNDPSDCNYPGEIIVATEVSALYPRDIVFEGAPTPDMEPLDAAAEALVEKVKKNWVHPIESLSGSYGDTLRMSLEAELSKARQDVGASTTQTLAAMQKQIEELQKQLAAKTEVPITPPAATPARRA